MAPRVARKVERLTVLEVAERNGDVMVVRASYKGGQLRAVEVCKRLLDGTELEEMRIYRPEEVRAVAGVIDLMRAPPLEAEPGRSIVAISRFGAWRHMLESARCRAHMEVGGSVLVRAAGG